MKSLVSKINGVASVLAMTLGTSIRKIAGGADRKRWSNPDALAPDWDSRTQRLGALVKPGSAVLEFGAGRLTLVKYLPQGCTYTPSDLVDRGNGTIVFDLNGIDPMPVFSAQDVAVFSGVLEYVNDVPKLISELSNRLGVVVASYAVTDFNNGNRRRHGWVNDFSSTDVIRIFETAGFSCNHQEQWRSQVIYRFEKK